MTHELDIRLATPSDLPGILALLRAAMPEAAGVYSDAFWRWKHLDSVFGPSLVMIAATPAAQVVGLRAFSWRTWVAGGVAHQAVRAVDTATHPDWRRRGLFERLNRALVEAARAGGAAFVFNTPNDKSRAGNLKLGWVDVGRIPVRLLPLRPLRALSRAARARNGVPATIDGFADDGSVAALLSEPRLDDLLERRTAEPEPRLQTLHTRASLAWRYGGAVGVQYVARWRFDGADGAVAIARRRPRMGFAETSIVELLATTGIAGRRAARGALVDLLGDCRSDLALASCATGTVEHEATASLLFVPAPAPFGPTLMTRALGPEPSPSPARLASWRGSVGDWELW